MDSEATALVQVTGIICFKKHKNLKRGLLRPNGGSSPLSNWYHKEVPSLRYTYVQKDNNTNKSLNRI